MLKICYRFEELNIHDLLRVYEESLRKARNQKGLNSFQTENDFCTYLEDVFFTAPGAFCAVWAEEERYVSVLRMEPYMDGLLLTGFETAPDERRKGYAGKLLCAVKEYAMSTNRQPIYSHIHKRNVASRSLHCKCGFMQISDFARLIDGTVSNNYYTLILK